MASELSVSITDPGPEPSMMIAEQLFAGGGEMGARMRALDWAETPLGPVSFWPQSLRTAVRILLGCGFPMLIAWGPEYIVLYNDAYRPVLGQTKHPGALGRSCREVLQEAWDFTGPLFEKVMSRGEDASTLTDQLFLLDRNGYLEECYFTFSYSPIPNDGGDVGGVFVTALETTQRVMEDRRRHTLPALASHPNQARREEELLAQAPAAIGLVNGPEHRWTYGTWEWNPIHNTQALSEELRRIFGLGQSNLNDAEEWATRVFPDDFQRVRQLMEDGNQSGEMDFEYRYLHPDLGLRWLHCKGSRGQGDSRMFGVVIDVTERKLTKRALKQNQERLRAIIETTPECVKIVAPDGTLLQMNSSGLTMVGATHAEMVVGRSIYDIVAAEDRQRFRDFNGRICAGAREVLEFDIIDLNGVRRHMESHAAPLDDVDGTTAQLAVTRDLTARKLAQDTARQREEEFRGLANSMPHLVWMANPDGNIFWYNQRWCDYTGSSPEEMARDGWERFHDAEILPSVVDRWRACLLKGEPFEMTFPLRGKDGACRPFLTRAVPVRDSFGNVTRWFGTNTDVSAAVEAQRQLQENKNLLERALVASQRLAAIVESSDDAIVSKDLKGIVTSWNRRAEQMFGFSAEEMIGQSIRKIIPEDLQASETDILATIEQGDRIEHFETIRRTKRGELIDVSLTISPVKDEAGRIVGAAKIARDITQKRKTEQALRTTERLAAVGRLAATVAHEMNNPLEAVTNLVYLARTAPSQQEATKLLLNAEEELRRVSLITKQTLGFYRETTGSSITNLGSLIMPLISTFHSRCSNKSISIETEIRQDPGIRCFPGEIRQLFANLLGNSIDAVPNGGRIRVRLSAAREWNGTSRAGIRLTVADSGHGIPASVKEKLFEPFFTTKKDVGTGLGLWICKSIIENHTGNIRVTSSVAPGRTWTVFSLFLPSDSAASELLRRQNENRT